MKTTIYLVRHGNSIGNVRKQVIGKTDVVLTKEGLRQGKKIAKHFRKKQVDAVYSSHLSRAETTAMYTAKLKKLPLNTDSRFAEFNFGDEYEGVTWTEAIKKEDGAYVRYRDPIGFTTVKFPKGGECVREVVDRLVSAILDLEKKHAGQNIVVVTHSVALMSFLVYLKNGCSLDGARREQRLPNASITTITIENGKFMLVEEGYTGHLDGITV